MTTSQDPKADGARCERYEREALPAMQRGRPLDDHFTTCPDCLKAAAAHRDLEERLRREGRDLRPPDHWQAGVWNAIEARSKRPRIRRGPAWLLLPVALTLALWLGKDQVFPPRDSKPLVGLEMTLIDGQSVRRSVDAQPGDVLRLRVPAEPSGVTELLLYRNGRGLVFRCVADRGIVASSGEALDVADRSALAGSCLLTEGVLAFEVELSVRGRYQALWVRGARSLLKLGDVGLDPAAALFLDAGAEVDLSDSVTVR